MESVIRFQVSMNLLLASLIAFLEIPIPRLFPGVVGYIVKKVNLCFENGQYYREPFCEQFRCEEQGTCDMAETDEQCDGDDDGQDESGSCTHGEYEPNGSKDD